jgi:hypothetical protein
MSLWDEGGGAKGWSAGQERWPGSQPMWRI